MGYVIEILVLQAMALQAQGKIDQALTPLERALSLAEPEGYVRTFVDEGPPMAQLLRQAVARGIAVDYVGKLLAALEKETKEKQRMMEPFPPSLVEPLSQRELEVLRLLTTHLSSTEIAEELFIAASTVRSHIKSIYGKLNVHSRKDAVRRAKELELL
jgi:LuxR family maltose regulon positive regulatory protein